MATSETANGGDSNAISPPYVSWATQKNAIEKMAREGGVPSQVDRSYLSNLPGSTQTQLIAAMKWLGLIDDKMKPTHVLEELVEVDEPARKEKIKALLQERYPAATSLPGLATQQQLEQTFRDLGVSGSTLRKAVAFFLGAAKFADLSLSPHFKTPRAPAAPGERKARKTQPAGGRGSASTPVAATVERAAGPSHHPLIEGLFQELPEPGAAFPQNKRDDWIELAKVTFRLIYKGYDEPRTGPTRTDEDGEPD